MTSNHFHHNQALGMSLIELLVALLISTILMFGVGTVYVSSKRGYNIQDTLARQQENSRFSLDILTRDLRMAGYLPSAGQDNDILKEPIDAASTMEGGGTTNDVVTVRYESTTDCLGQPTPANSCGNKQCALNRYSIDASSNLVCLGNGGALSEVVAEGVSNLQVLYGIDTDTSPDGVANKYVTWNNVNATERGSIVSVRFGILSNSGAAIKKADTTNTYALLDQNISATDKFIHRVYTSTVVLRNMQP